MLVILIFFISLICLTSVGATDLAGVSASDSPSLDLEISDLDSSSEIQEIEGSNSISSIDNDDVLVSNDESESDKALSSSSEDSISSSEESNEVNSLEEEKTLSSSKKTRLGDSTHLELDNDVDKENIAVGDLVTWILQAKNYGPNLAKNVKVFVDLPDGLKFVNYSASSGSFDFKTGIWDLGDLDANEKPILNIITKALTSGEKILKVNLTSDTNSTTPDECYEEEEIMVFDIHKEEVKSKKVVSNILYPTGNPIAVLLVSLMLLLGANIKRKI